MIANTSSSQSTSMSQSTSESKVTSTQIIKAEEYMDQIAAMKEITKENQDVYDECIKQAIRIYRVVTQNRLLSPKVRVDALMSCMKYSKFIGDEAEDIYTRLRDGTKYINNDKELQDHLTLLTDLCKRPLFPAYHSILIASYMFELMYYDVSYEMFEACIYNETCDVDSQKECCKYLYYSEINKYVELALDVLIQIVVSESIDEEYKYNTIVEYIPIAGKNYKGLRTKFRTRPLEVLYDESNIFILQLAFFNNEKHSIRKRILSGQYLLQCEFLKINHNLDWLKVALFLYEVGIDAKQDERTRADALDVVYRCCKGINELSTKAIDAIKDIGMSDVMKNDNAIMRKTMMILQSTS